LTYNNGMTAKHVDRRKRIPKPNRYKFTVMVDMDLFNAANAKRTQTWVTMVEAMMAKLARSTGQE
jgi:hypothetical protein